MRASTVFSAFLLLATGCARGGDLFLTRPGGGNTGSREETLAYYATSEALLRGLDRRFGAGATLADFLGSPVRCFDMGGTSVAAFYYNDSDLGLGREMRCAECGDGAPVPGLISCAVSNHGTPQGLDSINLRLAAPAIPEADARVLSILKSVDALERCGAHDFAGCRGATVAMDYLPVAGLAPERRVRFYIFDTEAPGKQTAGNQVPGGLIPGLRLDSDDRLNPDGVKFIRNCMSCHGGKFDHGEIQGATFLDFDVSLFVFGDGLRLLREQILSNAAGALADKIDVTVKLSDQAAQLEPLRIMNAMVQKVAQGTMTGPIEDRIFKSYVDNTQRPVGPVPGARYAFLPDTDQAYVPDGWPQTKLVRTFAGNRITARSFYLDGVRRYCATCHFSQRTGFNLQTREALTFFDYDQFFSNTDQAASPDSIHRDVCGSSDMPHAEVTRGHFRRDSVAVSLLCNGCNFDQAGPSSGECLD